MLQIWGGGEAKEQNVVAGVWRWCITLFWHFWMVCDVYDNFLILITSRKILKLRKFPIKTLQVVSNNYTVTCKSVLHQIESTLKHIKQLFTVYSYFENYFNTPRSLVQNKNKGIVNLSTNACPALDKCSHQIKLFKTVQIVLKIV